MVQLSQVPSVQAVSLPEIGPERGLDSTAKALRTPGFFRVKSADRNRAVPPGKLGQLGAHARRLVLESGKDVGRVVALLGLLSTPALADGIDPHQAAQLSAATVSAPWTSVLSTDQLRNRGRAPRLSEVQKDLQALRAQLTTLTTTYPLYREFGLEVEVQLAAVDAILKAELGQVAQDPRAVMAVASQLIGMDDWLYCAAAAVKEQIQAPGLPDPPSELRNPLLCQAQRTEGETAGPDPYPDFEAFFRRISTASKELHQKYPDGNVACLEACVGAYQDQLKAILAQAQNSGHEYLPDAALLLAQLETTVRTRLEAVEGWDQMLTRVGSAEGKISGKIWSVFFGNLVNAVMPFQRDWYQDTPPHTISETKGLGKQARFLGELVRDLHAMGIEPLQAQDLTQQVESLVSKLESNASEGWQQARERAIPNVIFGAGAAAVLWLVYLFAADYVVTRRNDRNVRNQAGPATDAMLGPTKDP